MRAAVGPGHQVGGELLGEGASGVAPRRAGVGSRDRGMARYRTGSVTNAPYGTWPSPLSPAVMGGARVSLAGLQVVGDTCWWSESRPHEGGRMVVMRLRRGQRPRRCRPPG